MFTVEDTELRVSVKVKSNYTTSRWVAFKIFDFSEVKAFVKKSGEFTERKAYSKTTKLATNQRKVFYRSRLLQSTDQRTAFLASVLNSERTVYYIANAEYVLANIKIFFPLTYESDIPCIVEDRYHSQRLAVYGFTESDKRLCYLERLRMNVLTSINLDSTLSYSDERQVYWSDTPVDDRTIMFAYSTDSERVCSFIELREAVLRPIPVDMQIELNSELTCIVSAICNDEKKVWIELSQGRDERQILVLVKIIETSDRTGYVGIMRYFSIQGYELIPATPYPSERSLSYKAIVHNAERKAIAPSGDRILIDTAFLNEPLKVLVPRLDENRTIKFKTSQNPNYIRITDSGESNVEIIDIDGFDVKTKFGNIDPKTLEIFAQQGTFFSKNTNKVLKLMYSSKFTIDVDIID